MAKAGVHYKVGREANSDYGETLNGVRAVTPKHQFAVTVDPYVTPRLPGAVCCRSFNRRRQAKRAKTIGPFRRITIDFVTLAMPPIDCRTKNQRIMTPPDTNCSPAISKRS